MVAANTDDEQVKVRAPLMLLTGPVECWKCHAPQSVIALATQHLRADGETIDAGDDADRDLIMLSNIVAMPPEIEALLTNRFPRYRKHFSKMAGHTYFANICVCGANFGDFFLISEPDGPFFPTTERLAAAVTIERLPFQGEYDFDAHWSQGGARLILDHGKWL
jgi:hypothetical protein